MRIRAFKYLSPLIIYVGSLHSFSTYGWLCYAPLIYAWIVIPLLELFLQPNAANLSEAEEEIARNDRTYDYILYLIVLLQMPTLFYYLYSMQDGALTVWDKIGRTGTMGLLCGTFGINVGHELGHRINKGEQLLAKLSLLSSLYMHFFIEHNKGHHKNVATPEDPSSARYGENIFSFWFRTVYYSYLSAWSIAGKETQKRERPVVSLYNEMLLFHLIQLAFVLLIYFVFGWQILLWYLGAALMGILLLETVNYIEHYGLQRKPIAEGRYERAMPEHSWNSNHVIGRLMLFELSRHSDHHYLASRKYQLLRHHDNAPQMPTGYPGMMILSLMPPLWFYVMNKRVKGANVKHELPELHPA
ncbi:MAG TPA: alkane 1-monooxygenase [Chitinophagaceae bacterium]|nr:alkane 1-monooxygenase [Chitinophagaceae bacterium]